MRGGWGTSRRQRSTGRSGASTDCHPVAIAAPRVREAPKHQDEPEPVDLHQERRQSDGRRGDDDLAARLSLANTRSAVSTAWSYRQVLKPLSNVQRRASSPLSGACDSVRHESADGTGTFWRSYTNRGGPLDVRGFSRLRRVVEKLYSRHQVGRSPWRSSFTLPNL